MKWSSLSILFVVCCMVFSHSSQAQLPIEEDFGTNAQTTASNTTTGFNNGHIATKRRHLSKNQELGAAGKEDIAIITSDITDFSKKFEDPASMDGNYMVVQPGTATGTGSSGTPAGPRNYVKTVIWSESESNLTHGDLYDLNFRASMMYPKSTSAAAFKKAFIRVTIKTTHLGNTLETGILDVPLKDLTNDFQLFKKYGFQILSTAADIQLELVYQKGDVITLAIDDIFFGKASLFKMKEFKYCVGDDVQIERTWTTNNNEECPPPYPTVTCTYTILKDGIAIGSQPTSFSSFKSYTFNSAGEYEFKMTAHNYRQFISIGAETDADVTNSYTVQVYAPPVLQAGKTDMILSEPIGDLSFTFKHQLVVEEATRFSWDFGDGNTSTKPEPSHTFGESQQQYQVTLNAYNGIPSCAVDPTQTEDITVCRPIDKPVVSFNATADVDNGAINVSNISSGFGEYKWFYGSTLEPETRATNVDFSIPANPQDPPLPYGKYRLVVRVAHSVSGCIGMHDVLVELCDDVTHSAVYNECEDECTFSVSSGNYNYVEWILDGTVLSDESPFTYTPSEPDETIDVKISTGCEIKTYIEVLKLKGEPNGDFIQFINENGELELTAVQAEAGYSFDWAIDAYDAANAPISGTSPMTRRTTYTTPSAAATVVVSLVVTRNGTSCSASTSQTICIPSSTHDCCGECSGS